MSMNKDYLNRFDELTNRAKQRTPYLRDCDIGERCYVELLHLYIYQFRTNQLTAEQLKQMQKELKDLLSVYYQHCEIFEQATQIRNRYSPVLTEAEKHGCPICKKIVRIFDGRE